MNILLDTHILLWSIQDSPKVPHQIRKAMINADRIFVSVASLWECAIKISSKKLEIDFEKLIKAIEESGYEILPIKPSHLSKLIELPPHHKDPFDRLLVAQSMAEPLRLQSHDDMVLHYLQ